MRRPGDVCLSNSLLKLDAKTNVAEPAGSALNVRLRLWWKRKILNAILFLRPPLMKIILKTNLFVFNFILWGGWSVLHFFANRSKATGTFIVAEFKPANKNPEPMKKRPAPQHCKWQNCEDMCANHAASFCRIRIRTCYLGSGSGAASKHWRTIV